MAMSSARILNSIGEAENQTIESEVIEGEQRLNAVDWTEIDVNTFHISFLLPRFSVYDLYSLSIHR